ncbi:MAG: hypothetical protein AB202_03070 [Parcubacteria bacterium C7867-007]|nr:MAG: hypothetical protein AB202_03070 [Parcubacteria bacterium C7867-007]
MNRPTLTTTSTFLLSTVLLSIPFLVFADDSFVPLTSLPGLDNVIGESTLPGFINNLYRLLIGAAAIVAVVEIIWAGFLFMNSNDSISANKKAKQKITNAIIGLVLVLSPYVVFSVINPKILDVNLDFGQLKGGDSTGGAGSTEDVNVISIDSKSSKEDAGAVCSKEGGNPIFSCKPEKGDAYVVTKDQACKTGETTVTTCTKPKNTDPNACVDTGAATVIAPKGDSSYSRDGYIQVKDSCCKGMTAGNVCWQKPK